jgi:Kinesin-like protein
MIATGSERARAAKTAGATLAEGGKINESLMYLGQCLQMQSDIQEGNKVSLQDILRDQQHRLIMTRRLLYRSDNASLQSFCFLTRFRHLIMPRRPSVIPRKVL